MKNLISTMVSQHRSLQGSLGEIVSLLKLENINAGKIDEELKTFTRNLTGHLTLENEVFYPKLLKQLEGAGSDVAKTKEFILEMKKIEKVVVDFLGKFKDAAAIEKMVVDFKKEIAEIIEVLNLRVESEESGVYGIFQE